MDRDEPAPWTTPGVGGATGRRPSSVELGRRPSSSLAIYVLIESLADCGVSCFYSMCFCVALLGSGTGSWTCVHLRGP